MILHGWLRQTEDCPPRRAPHLRARDCSAQAPSLRESESESESAHSAQAEATVVRPGARPGPRVASRLPVTGQWSQVP